MKTIKGPAIFLAQFAADAAPFNSLQHIAHWAGSLGYKGVQIPSWDGRLFDLKRAAESKTYCDEVLGTLATHGLQLTELSTHLQGQLVAVHPAYDSMFDGFAPEAGPGKPQGPAGVGGGTTAVCGQGVGKSGSQGACHFFRGAGLALRLPVAATARGTRSRPPSRNCPPAGCPF